MRGRANSRVNFMEAFWLATAGGAEALDIKTGRFETGYRFDAVLIDASVADSNLVVWPDEDAPEDVFQKIVYTAERNNIRKVWVDGRLTVDKDAG